MRLTVLGCDGSYPGPGGACSGYLVRTADTTVWVDAGTGTLANLQRHIGLDDVDGIVLSHAHPDHWTDVQSYNVACMHMGRSGVGVHAPSELAGFLRQYEPTFALHPISDGSSAAIGDLGFTFSKTDHPVETFAMRIEGAGRVLAYSADTSSDWSLGSLGPGIDLALVEACFLADAESLGLKHLSARQAGEQAATARAARLMLTHIWPTVDHQASRAEAAAAFEGSVEIAGINDTYDV